MEAAARLQVPYHTALRFLLTGKIRGEQVDRHWFVDCQSVEQFKRERSTAAQLQPVA